MRISTLIILTLIFVGNASLAKEMTFELSGNGGNCTGCMWIAAQGDITEQTPAHFSEFFAENPYQVAVVLNSDGGDLLSAMELGARFRKAGVDTYVGKTVSGVGDLSSVQSLETGSCSSVCVFAFMGGLDRGIYEASTLGIGQFDLNSMENEKNVKNAELMGMALTYALKMGVSPEVIVAATAERKTKKFWFNADEMRSFGLTTQGEINLPWSILPLDKGLILKTTYIFNARRSTQISIFCRAPEHYYLMITEEDSHWTKEHPNGQILTFGEGGAGNPRLLFAEEQYSLLEDYFETQTVSKNRFIVSFQIPVDLSNYAGKAMTFDPRLAQVHGTLLWTTVNLPPKDWIEAIGRNCIS